MRLVSVEIMNFRSIRNIKINLKDTNCCILVGKNESGKSNILRAMSLLNPEVDFSPEDKREGLQDESVITDSYVEFELLLSNDEIDAALDKFKDKFLCNNLEDAIITNGKQNYSLSEFCHIRNTGFYQVNIEKSIRTQRYYRLPNSFKLLPKWKKVRKTTSETVTLNGNDISLKDFEYINIEDFPVSNESIQTVTAEEFNAFVWGRNLCGALTENLPSVVSWVYDEKYILPPYINVSEFASDPDTCLPLKSMFNLAQIEDIKEQINDTFPKPHHSFRNLLQRVAVNTTTYFREVWKEYKTISFQLIPNGERIDIGIKDSFNTFGFSQRSDGFKRFVSFLLLVASRAKMKSLTNCIILIDEPDLGLHPSGKRYLRDELIKISDNNIVLFSTHSIFMIDSNNVYRHLLVKKTNEITNITPVTESNYVDEEVIFNALGYSVFQTLKECNLIFEGWKDKKLFEIAMEKPAAALKKLSNYGLCHVQGVKQVANVAPIFDCANRKYVIVTDGDAPARERQKHYNEGRYSGPWKRYDELLGEGYLIETVEDFIKDKALIKAINMIKKDMPELPPFKAELLQQPKSKIKVLEEWLKDISNGERKDIITKVKDVLFDKLTRSDIDQSYYEMLKNLQEIAIDEQLA